MSCTPQNTFENTNGASGDDGEEWTNVPSHGGSESTTTGAEAPQTTTVLVPKKVAIEGAIAWAKRNWAGKPGQKAYVKGNSIVLSGGTSEEREKTATVFRKLMQDWAKPKGAKTSGKDTGGKKGGKLPVYFAPAELFFKVVKPLVEAEGFECRPLGKSNDGKMSRYGISGKTLEEREAMAQQVTDHCVDIVVFKVPSAKVWAALKKVAKELKGIRFTVIGEEGDMTQYVLEGETSEDREDFAQAVGMTAYKMIQAEAEMDFYTVPADQAYGALNQAKKGQSAPSKWGGIPLEEHVDFQLRGYTDKTGKVSRYTISGGTSKSQAAFVAKVNSNANMYKRNDKAKATVAKEAAKLEEKEAAEYAKFTNEQRDPEGYFEREAKRKATMTKGKPPMARGSAPVGYAGAGPAEENPFWLEAQRKTKQEKQAAQTVRAEEKQREAALEKKKATEVAAIKAELEKQKAAEAAKHAQAIAATNSFAAAFGSDDEDVEEPERTPAKEEVTHGPRAVTPTAPSGEWIKGTPTVKVVEKAFSQSTPKGKGKAKVVTSTADTHDDSDCEDWEERSSFYD
jgi:hypothetical protein